MAFTRSIANAANKKKRLFIELHGQCQGCKKHLDLSDLSLDHICPVADGGKGNIENLTLLCEPCNRLKGSELTLSGLRRIIKYRQIGLVVERPSVLRRICDWVRGKVRLPR